MSNKSGRYDVDRRPDPAPIYKRYSNTVDVAAVRELYGTV